MRISSPNPSITTAAARLLIEAAEAEAASLDLRISACVVDASGTLKAFSRMDGAPLVSVAVARKKALTATGFGMPTGQAWFDFVSGDPVLLHGVDSIDDFTMLGGGLPVLDGGTVVGGIGVSGGHYTQDERCARAALAALAV